MPFKGTWRLTSMRLRYGCYSEIPLKYRAFMEKSVKGGSATPLHEQNVMAEWKAIPCKVLAYLSETGQAEDLLDVAATMCLDRKPRFTSHVVDSRALTCRHRGRQDSRKDIRNDTAEMQRDGAFAYSCPSPGTRWSRWLNQLRKKEGSWPACSGSESIAPGASTPPSFLAGRKLGPQLAILKCRCESLSGNLGVVDACRLALLSQLHSKWTWAFGLSKMSPRHRVGLWLGQPQTNTLALCTELLATPP